MISVDQNKSIAYYSGGHEINMLRFWRLLFVTGQYEALTLAQTFNGVALQTHLLRCVGMTMVTRLTEHRSSVVMAGNRLGVNYRRTKPGCLH